MVWIIYLICAVTTYLTSRFAARSGKNPWSWTLGVKSITLIVSLMPVVNWGTMFLGYCFMDYLLYRES